MTATARPYAIVGVRSVADSLAESVAAGLTARLPVPCLSFAPRLPVMSPMLPANSDRRDLLQSVFGEWLERLVAETERKIIQRRYVRPPGALPEVGFLTACTRCGACVPACPVQAIRTAGTDAGLAAGTPFLDPERQPCVVCTDMPCARACPTGALSVPIRGWEGYRLTELEFLPENCVTFQGTECRVCVDACPVGEEALVVDGTGHPSLRREGCVGCGMCVRDCIARPKAFRLHYAEG
jgi:ferredoxin-type protein NapG